MKDTLRKRCNRHGKMDSTFHRAAWSLLKMASGMQNRSKSLSPSGLFPYQLEIVDHWSTTLFPSHKSLDDLCDLDFWPIDMEMVCNTSSPHGFYSFHISMKITWFIVGIFLVECVGSVYAPSTYLYLWGEMKELILNCRSFPVHCAPWPVQWLCAMSHHQLCSEPCQRQWGRMGGWSLHWSYALYEKDTCYNAGNLL